MILSPLAFLAFSCLPFVMYWVLSEKTVPFYFQSKSAWFYLIVVLILSFGLTIYHNMVLPFDLNKVAGFHLEDALPRVQYDSLNGLDVKYGVMHYIYNHTTLFLFDGYSFMSRCLLILTTLICALYGYYYTRHVRLNYFEPVLYVLCALLGMLIFVTSNNLLVSYVAIELQSFCFYLLAASQRKSPLSLEAGLKYLFIGSVGSGLLVLSFSILYYSFATLDITQLFLLISQVSVDDGVLFNISVSFLLFFLAFFVKLGVAPFHYWVADVYEGSPTFATLFFLVVPKLAMFSVFFRFITSVFLVPGMHHTYITLFVVAIAASFLFGYSGALSKGITLKRFYAFSGITHLGFILLSTMYLSHADSVYLDEGGDLMYLYYPVFYYVILYTTIMVAAVRLLLIFVSDVDTTTGRQTHYVLEALPTNYNLVNPANAIAVFLLFIIFIGIPPTAGFFMKLYPLLVLIMTQSYATLLFVIWPFIVLSGYVYARIIVLLFFRNNDLWEIRSWKTTQMNDSVTGWLYMFLLIFLSTYVFQADIISFIVILLTPEAVIY